MIANFQKYLIASVVRVVQPSLDAYKLYVEGVDFDEKEILRNDNIVLRTVGPNYYPQIGQDHYKYQVTLLLTKLLNHSDNAYDLHDKTSEMAVVLSNPIPVSAWGQTPETSYGCLDKDPKDDDFVRIIDFGIIEKDIRYHQMAVIAKYSIDI